MSTLDITCAAAVDAGLRRRWPQLPDPLVLYWSELPVLALDRETPWLYGPIERDPLTAPDGRTVLPRSQILRLRELARLDLPLQRLAFAHELDPLGAVRDLVPTVRNGPRTCTDAVARAVVGHQPAHPAVRTGVQLLDRVVRRRAIATVGRALETVLDPILFGVIGLPDTTQGRPALFYPLAKWMW